VRPFSFPFFCYSLFLLFSIGCLTASPPAWSQENPAEQLSPREQEQNLGLEQEPKEAPPSDRQDLSAEMGQDQEAKQLDKEAEAIPKVRAIRTRSNRSRVSEMARAPLQKIKTNPKKIESSEDLVISDYDSDQGIFDKAYHLNDDSSRLGIAFQANADLTQATRLIGLDASYAYHLGNFWPSLMANITQAKFSEISKNPQYASSRSNPLSETSNPKPLDSNENLLILGAGMGYRFLLPTALNWFNIDNLFNVFTAYATYISLKEGASSQTYTGFGLRTDYELTKRISSKIDFGIKISYHWGEVKRNEAFPSESSNDRTLSLSWMSAGLGTSYYF
jgi:hypothetical protein